MHGVINMENEDGFEPTSEFTHLSLPTRYELANGFTSIPSRLLGDLEEKHLPQTFSIATRVAHDGIRIAVTSVRIALSNLKVQHLKDLLESRRSCSGAKKDILVARRIRGGLAPAQQHAWGEPVD